MRTRFALAAATAGCVLATGAAAASPAAAAPPACHPTVHDGLIPSWARGGFSSPRPHMPFALSRHHRIAALVFGFPLVAPPDARRSNKILWVSHARLVPGDDLRISAQRMRGTTSVGPPKHRVVDGGPGPSGVDLPAGCWRLTLRWSGHHDTIDLRYRRHA
jgi:hypothetical protein